jgi:hypothetical protein
VKFCRCDAGRGRLPDAFATEGKTADKRRSLKRYFSLPTRPSVTDRALAAAKEGPSRSQLTVELCAEGREH